MDVVAEIVRGVVALLLLAALLELLLPEGSTARFIRVAIGLMLMASILLPLLHAVPKEPAAPAWQESSAAAEAYVEQGNALAVQLQQEAQLQFSAEMGQQVAALALLADGVEEACADVLLDEAGAVAQMVLYLQGSNVDRAAAEQAVRMLLCGFYLVQEEQIVCIWEEVEGANDGA